MPVNLGLLLQRLGEAYIDVAEEGGRHLVVQTGDGLSEVEGDEDLLMQLCANLVENAMRHAPEGTHILLEARQEGQSVVLTCSDDGHGIPEVERARVFQRLYRVEKSRTTPGSGLGLSLVKAIVELHGATVTLEDNSPGLRVSVVFPATDVPVSPSR
jgi:signal transduction histidine kinase